MKSIYAVTTLAFTLAGCAALFGTPMSPEERACVDAAAANRPDLTGSWKTNDGVTLDIRHRQGNPRALDIAAASGSPKKPEWVVAGAGLVTPGVVPSTTTCSNDWTIDIARDYPNRKPAGPGQSVSQRDRTTATLSAAADTIRVGREAWTRVGAVGARQLPKPV